LSAINKFFTQFFDLIHSGITAVGITNPSLSAFLDIFIFTLIIKMILLPLTIKQTKSTVKMGSVQPKLKALQDKYKNDPQKLQEKQMQLYKEEGVSPFAGCLPLIIQYPILIAMYYAVNSYVGFKGIPFLWVPDLYAPDPWILPVISGVTTLLSGLMMAPKTDDPSSKTTKSMNIFMSIFFVYISRRFKAALVLYWIISNLIQLAQQYFIIGKVRKEEEQKLNEKAGAKPVK
jgi:YidC/Oxa1 family membrane protein insertase